MIEVLNINKKGNKIVSYTCTDGSKTLGLTKEQLIYYIDNKQVTNAKKQLYKGNVIIRVNTTKTKVCEHNNIEKELELLRNNQIIISKNSKVLNNFINLGREIYKKLCTHRKIMEICDVKNIDLFLNLDGDKNNGEYFIYTNNRCVYNLNNLVEETLDLDNAFINIACQDNRGNTIFYMFLELSMDGKYWLYSNDNYKVIARDTDRKKSLCTVDILHNLDKDLANL